MLTPIEIENKEFKKALRGFKEEEVDEFLDIVKEDYEQLYRENTELKEKVQFLKNQLDGYEDIKEQLNAALIKAESVAEDTCKTANLKAKMVVEKAESDSKIMLDEANLQSRQIISQANNRVVEIRKEYDSLLKEFKIFRNKFKSLLNDELKSIDEIFLNVDNEEVPEFNEPSIYEIGKEIATTID